MPKLTFVVPAFQASADIAETLHSLLDQTVKDIEIIVVDDGSTDSTARRVKYFTDKDKRVLYVRQENSGRSAARNMGNSLAQSPIIAVNDADDPSFRERAQITLDYFKKHPKTDVFYAGMRVCDMYLRPAQDFYAKPFSLDEMIKAKVSYIPHSSMAYRKEVAKEFPYEGGEVSKLGIDDWDLQIRMANAGKVFGFDAKPIFLYRQRSDSTEAVRNSTEVYKNKMAIMTKLGLIKEPEAHETARA